MSNLTYICDNKRHLICLSYSVDNLHIMVNELGISRAWFHSGNKPHYDIPISRVEDIQAQCQIASPKEIVRIIKNNL